MTNKPINYKKWRKLKAYKNGKLTITKPAANVANVADSSIFFSTRLRSPL